MAAAPHDPLAALRPIHWPDPVSWWPVAIGWWVLLALLLVSALLIWYRWRANRKLHGAKAALKSLRLRPTDDGRFVIELNRILKRIALLRFPRRDVAALSGEDWLAFLESTSGHGEFRQGIGRLLADAPYRRHPEAVDRKALLALSRRWAVRIFKSGQS